MRARCSCSQYESPPPLRHHLQGLALPLHEGHGVIPARRALLPLHLDLGLRRQLQLDGAGVDLGGTQQLFHALHLLALKHDHRSGWGGVNGWGRLLLLRGGGGRWVRGRRLGFSFSVSCSLALRGAPAASSITNFLGLSSWRLGGGGGGGGGGSGRRWALLLQLGLPPGASSAALSGVITGLVIFILRLGLFGDDGNLLTHLRTRTHTLAHTHTSWSSRLIDSSALLPEHQSGSGTGPGRWPSPHAGLVWGSPPPTYRCRHRSAAGERNIQSPAEQTEQPSASAPEKHREESYCDINSPSPGFYTICVLTSEQKNWSEADDDSLLVKHEVVLVVQFDLNNWEWYEHTPPTRITHLVSSLSPLSSFTWALCRSSRFL